MNAAQVLRAPSPTRVLFPFFVSGFSVESGLGGDGCGKRRDGHLAALLGPEVAGEVRVLLPLALPMVRAGRGCVGLGLGLASFSDLRFLAASDSEMVAATGSKAVVLVVET